MKQYTVHNQEWVMEFLRWLVKISEFLALDQHTQLKFYTASLTKISHNL